MPDMQEASPRSSFENLISKSPLCFPGNSTSFPLNNMSFTYTYQKGCSAPTHFLVNIGLSKSLYKTICFDHTIKAYISTPRCLHQSIDRSLDLALFVSTIRIDKTFWLHYKKYTFVMIRVCHRLTVGHVFCHACTSMTIL